MSHETVEDQSLEVMGRYTCSSAVVVSARAAGRPILSSNNSTMDLKRQKKYAVKQPCVLEHLISVESLVSHYALLAVAVIETHSTDIHSDLLLDTRLHLDVCNRVCFARCAAVSVAVIVCANIFAIAAEGAVGGALPGSHNGGEERRNLLE